MSTQNEFSADSLSRTGVALFWRASSQARKHGGGNRAIAFTEIFKTCLAVSSGVTRGLSQGGQTFLKGPIGHHLGMQ